MSSSLISIHCIVLKYYTTIVKNILRHSSVIKTKFNVIKSCNFITRIKKKKRYVVYSERTFFIYASFYTRLQTNKNNIK